LVTQNFLGGLFALPPSLPLYIVWVYLTSGVFIIAAAGIFLKVQQQLAAAMAGSFFFLLFLFLHLPRLIANIHNPVQWTVTFEVLALGSGAFVIAYFLSNGTYGRPEWIKTINTIGIAGRYLFAFSLVIFAIQHIMYEPYIESLIPSWMPVPVLWSWLVIAGFLLGAFSLITRIRLYLAATLLGSMFLLWVLILHAPRAISKLTIEAEWTSLCIALAVSGIAFSIPFTSTGATGSGARGPGATGSGARGSGARGSGATRSGVAGFIQQKPPSFH
jgi:hypothetical protein